MLVRQGKWIVSAALTVICLLSWSYLLAGAGTGMDASAMVTWQFPPPVHATSMAVDWDPFYWLTMLAMWWVMMIAMMLPSAAPVILLYARVYRHGQRQGQIDASYVPTASFLTGYLFAWLVFSLIVTALQWLLESSGLMDAMMMWSTSSTLSALFLAIAGAYQCSPLKTVCLKHCRSPAESVSRWWRNGRAGAAVMGIEHGMYCIGCCWSLMALLFVGGAMNLIWIAGLALFVLLEKLGPYEYWTSRATGLLMLAAAGYLFTA